MPDTITLEQSWEAWAGWVAGAWAVVMLATELKVSIPYIHWVVSALALIATWPYLRHIRPGVRFPAQVPARLFVFAICVPVLYGAKAIYSVAEACKLAVILLGAIFIFVARTYLAHCAFRGFIISVCMNLLLLLGGCWGLGTAEEMAPNRWGTFISWPGSLWRVAGSVWVYAAYSLVKRRSPISLVLLAMSTFLVYMDGSRTALLLVIVGALYVVLVLAAEAGQLLHAVMVGAMGLGLILLGIAYSGVLSGDASAEERGAVGRAGWLVNSVQASGVEGFATADVIRYQMLQDVVGAIRAHPVLGTGIETTVTETIVGPMGTHMTYLQVWADMGLLGLAAYIWLVWGWIPWVPRVLRRVQALTDPAHRAIYYNAIYVLFFFAVAGFFHPLSTEWSEWVIFIVAYALVWEVAQPREGATTTTDANMDLTTS